MKKNPSEKSIAVIALVITIFVVLVIFSLFKTDRPQSKHDEPKPKIAATIFPIYDMVRFLVGDHYDVDLLLPEGESIVQIDSIFELADLSEYHAIFAVGHGLDTLPDTESTKTFTVDRNITLLLEQGSTGSPYYWLSVKQAPQIAQNITEILIELDPEHAVDYNERLRHLHNQLAFLDESVTELFEAANNRRLVVYGYDWSYFTQDYDLDIAHYSPVAEEISDSTSRIDELSTALNENALVSVFSDITIPPAPLLSIVARQNGVLLNLDILGGLEDRTSYLALMAYNAQTIFEGLKQ